LKGALVGEIEELFMMHRKLSLRFGSVKKIGVVVGKEEQFGGKSPARVLQANKAEPKLSLTDYPNPLCFRTGWNWRMPVMFEKGWHPKLRETFRNLKRVFKIHPRLIYESFITDAHVIHSNLKHS
jgi:hypothetical protein